MKKAIKLSIMLLLATLLFSCPIEGGGSKKKKEPIHEVETRPSIVVNTTGNFSSGKMIHLYIVATESYESYKIVGDYSSSYDNSLKKVTFPVDEVNRNSSYLLISYLVDSNNVVLAQYYKKDSSVNSIELTNNKPVLTIPGGEMVGLVNSESTYEFTLQDSPDGDSPISTPLPRKFKPSTVEFSTNGFKADVFNITGPGNVTHNFDISYMEEEEILFYEFRFTADKIGTYQVNFRYDDGFNFEEISLPLIINGSGSGQGGVDVTIN